MDDEEAFDLVFKNGLQETDGDMIKQMLAESQYFYIGSKKFTFLSNDKIFYRSTLNSDFKSSKECQACDEPFKTHKAIKYW